MININGSIGEGGGQILRTALSLSMATAKPFRMVRIRAKRSMTGLRRQHVTAVNAAAKVCNARLTGNTLGSQELVFIPGPVVPGQYAFSVGTAGSTALVLQTLLPPLLIADKPSFLSLGGGTHNPHAPPFDFLEKAFLPLIRRMGSEVQARLVRYGFFPVGAGQIDVTITPIPALRPLHLPDRGPILGRHAKAIIANLPIHIARRELRVVQEHLNWPDSCFDLQVAHDVKGHGNALIIEIQSGQITEVFTGIGRRGLRAEQLAANTVDQAKQYLNADVPVGKFLADQLLLPLALAGSGSFKTLPLSPHTTTNIQALRQFLDIQVNTSPAGPDTVLLEIHSDPA